MKHRNHIEIVVDVLNYMKDQPRQPSRIMGVCNLSFTQMQALKEELTATQAITIKSQGRYSTWEITPPGRRALEAFSKALAVFGPGVLAK